MLLIHPRWYLHCYVRVAVALLALLLPIEFVAVASEPDDERAVGEKPILTLPVPNASAVVWSPDSKFLAIGMMGVRKGEPRIVLWSVATGRRVGGLHVDERSGPAFAIAFSPDGNTLVSGGRNHSLRYWDMTTHKQIARQRIGQHISSVAFSPDGKLLAVGDQDGHVQLIAADTRKVEAEQRVDRHGSVVGLAFSPDGKTLATCGRDTEAHIFEVPSLRKTGVLRGHREYLLSISVSASGNLAATTSRDGTLRIWDLEGGKQRRTMQLEPRPLIAKFHPRVDLLAVTREYNIMEIYDPENGKKLRVLYNDRHITEYGGMMLAFSPDGTLVATATPDGVKVWRVADGPF